MRIRDRGLSESAAHNLYISEPVKRIRDRGLSERAALIGWCLRIRDHQFKFWIYTFSNL